MITNQSETATTPQKVSPPRRQGKPKYRRLLRQVWFWLLLWLVGLVGTGGTAFADLLLNYGVTYGTQLDRIPYVKPAQLGANPVGVNFLLTGEDDPNSPDIDRSLDMIKAGGFGFARVLLRWEQIEPERGVYNWQYYDTLVEKAQARNLQLLVALLRPPAWSRLKVMQGWTAEETRTLTGPPDDYNDYFDFAGQVAARYKGHIKYYQIWNEPNLPLEWNNQKADPAAYTRLLKGAYLRIKAADNQAVVLSAPLAPTDVLDPNALPLNDLVYLDRMYQAGARDYFDVLSLQIYGLGYSPDFRFIQPQPGQQDLKRVNFNRPASVHEVMTRNGDGNKPAWASEYGWIAIPDQYAAEYNHPTSPDGRPKQWGENISEEEQANYLVQGIERIRREWPWIGVVNVWFFRADPNLAQRPADPTNYFSLVRPDFQPRPAYAKLKTYLATSSQTDYTGWNPAAGDPAIGTQGTAWRYQFQGERAEIVAKTGGSALSLSVKIDGQNSRQVQAGPGERVTLADGLSDGPHNLEISGVSPDQIEGFYISRDNHWAWLIALALLVFGLSFVTSGVALMIFAGIGAGRLVPAVRRSFWPARRVWTPFAMVAALLLYYFAPVPLAIAGAVLFLPLCLVRPDWALGLAALTAPLYLHPRNLRSGGTLQFTLTEVITVELAAAWVLRLAWQLLPVADHRFSFNNLKLAPQGYSSSKTQNLPRRGTLRVKLTTLRQYSLPLSLLALGLLATLSLLVPPSYHLKEALREYREIVFEPIVLGGLALFLLRKQGSAAVVRLMDFMVVSGVAVALVGIYQFFLPSRDASQLAVNTPSQVGCTVTTEGVVRVCSVFSHPDSLGLFLGRIIPLALAVAFFYKDASWQTDRRRQLYALALLPLLATLVVSFSRGAWLGTAVAVLIVLVAARSRRGLMAYGGLALLGLAAIPFVKIERILSVFDPTRGSGATRVYIWQSAIQMIKDHPMTGLGLDQFLYYYNPQYVNPLAWTERFTSHPHNMFLDFWLRLGILGVPVLLWLLFSAGRVAWKVVRSGPPKGFGLRQVLALGLLGSMVDFAVHGLVDNSYFMVDLAVLFCLSFAMLEILRQETTKEKGT